MTDKTDATKVATFKPLNSSEFGKELKNLKEFLTKFDRRLDRLVRSILYHAMKHGDVSAASHINDTLKAIDKTSLRANSLRKYFESYGPFVYDTETKAFKLDKKRFKHIQDHFPTDADKLDAVSKLKMWFVESPEGPYKPMDFLTELDKLISKAEKRANSGKGDKVDLALLSRIRTVAAANGKTLVTEPGNA